MTSFVKSLGSAAAAATQPSITVNPTAASAAGNTIVINCIQASISGFSSVTDTKGNTYTKIKETAVGTSHCIGTFIAYNTAALTTSDTITLTSAVSNQYPVITVYEFTPVNGTVDITTSAVDAGTSSSTYNVPGVAMPSSQNHLLLGVIGASGAGRSQTPSGTWQRMGASGDSAPTFPRTVMSMWDEMASGTLAASGTLSGSARWCVHLIALLAPASTPTSPWSYWNGTAEILLFPKVWNGTTEIPITSFTISGEVPPDEPPPPSTSDSAFITAAQASTLAMSGTSAGYTSTKSLADQMRAGSLTPSMDSVDNRVGTTALSCAVYWLAGGKTDSTLLSALKTYILAAPGTSLPATQALNPMRAIGALLMAVDIIKSNGGSWDDNATLPNLGGITFASWLATLETRNLGTGNSRWQTIMTTATDSANNWGSVARFALVAVARLRGDATLMATAVNWFKRYLGDTTVVSSFNRTSDYIASWDNTGSATGKVNAGLGFVDAAQPGRDGVVIDDVNRGVTGYSATADYFGATGAGLTYPLEAAEYVWATTAVLHNLGYDVLNWSNQAVLRMGDWFDRAKSGTTTAYAYAEGAFSIYKSYRWFGNKMRGGTPYGTPPATSGTFPRALPMGDWIAAPTSTWMA